MGFWERLGIDEGGLPTHLPMGVNEHGQGPTEPELPYRYQCWCGDQDCPLTAALRDAWYVGRQSMAPQCGGCRGLGAHRKHCPRSPTYNRWAELADKAEDLGDQIGSNDMGAANAAYGLAGRLRARAKEDR